MKNTVSAVLALALLALSGSASARPPIPEPGDEPPYVGPVAPALPTRPAPYVRPPSTARAPACAGSQRDATCLGFTNIVGSRTSDNAAPTLQPITNARPIPQKPDLLPLGPIIERDGQEPTDPRQPGNPRNPPGSSDLQ